MAIYIELEKVADDGRTATYSFTVPDGPRRVLVFDRQEERIWPEDNTEDATFHAAARTVAKMWREHGELPETMAYQA